MSDTSIAKIIQYGTQAERVAFTPDPAAGSQVLYIWYETDNAPDTYVWNGSAWVQINTGGGSGLDQLTGDVTAGPGSGSQAATIVNFDLSTVNGRLTLTTGVPVTTADVTGASTIYFTPYKGNKIALYTGSAWRLMTFSELSLALSGLTSGRPYDVFIDYNGGTPQITITAWTNDTTRATALTLQNGVLVQTGNTDWRYVGTIYTTSTTTTEDSNANRYVWNYYNRVNKPMRAATETTDSWNYTLTDWRQANANTANQLNFIIGVNEDLVEATVVAMGSNASSQGFSTGIGLDSTTTPSSLMPLAGSLIYAVLVVTYYGFTGIGRHFLAWLESSNASGTTTWAGDLGADVRVQTGITGRIMS